MEACAYRRPGFGRDRVPTALRLGLEIKGLFGSAGNQALVPRNQEMGSINSSAEGQAGCRSVPSTHGYLVYAGRGKGSVLSRVPTHFRPESPPSRRKSLCFQYGGCPGHAPICLLTANSGLDEAANLQGDEDRDEREPAAFEQGHDAVVAPAR